MAHSQYEIPPYGTLAPYLHGWLTEAVQEGAAWLQTQRPAVAWEGLIDRFSTNLSTDMLSGMSNARYPKDKRIARELVAALSNFRHEGEFAPYADRALYDQADVLTRIDQEWSRNTHAYLAYRAALQYAIVLGTGYLVQEWDKHFHGPFKGDIRLTAFAPQDITFVQLPKDGDIQRAYTVLIRWELPINLAKRIYSSINPAFAASLVPDRSTPGWLTRGLRKVQEFLSPALRVAGRDNREDVAFPTVDIYHAYTMDGSMNESPLGPVRMGAMDTNWSYSVPRLGDPVPMGKTNPATGQEFTRAATHGDCLLFPLRRLSIFTRSSSVIAYDGSSPWWHGQVPVARVKFSDWPWEALGQSSVADLQPMQESIEAMMRAMEDSAAARLDPPALIDDTLVSKTWAESFNPRRAGSRALASLQLGDPIKYPIDPDQYDVPQWIPEFIAAQEGRMDYLAAVQDLSAIAKAKQLPAADTIEKLLEMAGPIVQDMVRAVEEPLLILGEQRKSHYFQFYTYPRLLQLTGDEAEDMDELFTPDKILPLITDEDATARNARARRYLHEFKYTVSQSGISEINRMTTKLFYLQIMQRGFPLSWWTFAKVAQIPNFGPEPKGTHNEMERWIAQQRLIGELQMKMAEEQAQAAAAMGITGPSLPGGSGGPGEGEGAPGSTTGNLPTGMDRPEGRPPSNNAPPRMVQKDHGSRTTIETSR